MVFGQGHRCSIDGVSAGANADSDCSGEAGGAGEVYEAYEVRVAVVRRGLRGASARRGRTSGIIVAVNECHWIGLLQHCSAEECRRDR